jgi:hypothetical protein
MNQKGVPFDYYSELVKNNQHWKDNNQLALNFNRFLFPEQYNVDFEKKKNSLLFLVLQ